MGRWSTGVQTTGGSKRIELSYLLKNKFIVKGKIGTGQIEWTCRGEPTGNIGIETRYVGDGNDYIRLFYSLTENGNNINYDYKIKLIERDSNLGKGKVLDMVCSQSGIVCRILYMAYGSHHFKARLAYDKRLYYSIQTSSKLDRANSRFFELQKELETEDKRRKTYKYDGLATKRAVRNQRLEILYDKMDYLRGQSFMHSAYKILGKKAFEGIF